MARLKHLDVVRTPKGNIGVVDGVGSRGTVSLTYKQGVHDMSAWWEAEDLEYLFNVADMVEALDTDTIKELIRLRRKENE